MLRPILALLALASPLLVLPAQAAPASIPASTQAAARALAAVTSGPGGTLERRDLRLRLDDLAGADRTAAERLLARPNKVNRERDFDRVRVHWTAGETTSEWVDLVGEISDEVFDRFVAAGYRAPKPDGTRGGNSLLDIYVEDLGSGSYGYCSSDEKLPTRGPFDAWAYCAFDNDYQGFPHTPEENLQVTAAHELFHAVQFGYDYLEDAWLLESTAAWVEDELYDDVDDNVQYLGSSPLALPGRSMDRFERGGIWHYGVWIFFRFLTERYPDARGGLPTLVRQIWERADGDADGPDDYSIQATARVLAERGTSLRSELADFAAANRRPGATYDEGAANGYPRARLAGTVALADGRRDSGVVRRSVDHLASATVRFTRAPSMRASKLRIRLDLPNTRRGSGAVATVYRSGGEPTVVRLPLNARGNLTSTVEFGSDVTSVEVTMANAGIGYRCWRGTAWSCQGRSTDDNLRMEVRATALR